MMLHTTPLSAQDALPDTVEPDTLEMLPPEFEFDFALDFGMSRIENNEGNRERYFATAFMPDFYYGDFSGGLLFRMHLNAKNGMKRSEDYDSANDYLSLIRFFQYQEKGAPGYYVRFGEFEDATLGFGQFINLFRNSISLDEQKRGLEVNYNAGNYLFEGIYSNVLAPEVFGLRGAYFPMAEDPVSRYEQLSVGVTIAGDLNEQGDLINIELPGAPYLYEGLGPGAPVNTAVGISDGTLMMGGLDVSLPVFVTETSAGLTYAELSKIFGHGSGLGVGFSGVWHLPDSWRLETQLEQRLMGKSFIPNYFNSLYEVTRLQQFGIPVENGDDINAINSKRNTLTAQDRVRFGSFVTMAWRWKRTFRFRWSFEHAWNLKDSGWFHFDLRLKSPEIPVYLRLTFDQLKTQSLQDVTITGNNLNFLRFESAIKVLSMLMVGLGVRNSYEPTYENGLPVGARKRRRFEPKFIVVLPK